ncbi:MAG: YoaK family protein [Kiritimatiellia bacterium]
MNGEKQMSDAFRTAAILAAAGGFLETYTFLLHGHVFANAQTGNIALCGMAIARGDVAEAVKYLTPVLSFAAGVGLVEIVRLRARALSRLHWRQLMVLTEVALLTICFFLPGAGGSADMAANLVVSIACALQVQTFRKVHDAPFASTMCTGNLRSLTLTLIAWRRTKERGAGARALHLAGVIGAFLAGAAIALPVVSACGAKAVAVPIALLLATVALMAIKPSGRDCERVG